MKIYIICIQSPIGFFSKLEWNIIIPNQYRIRTESDCDKLNELFEDVNTVLFKRVPKGTEWAAVWFTALEKNEIAEIGKLEKDFNLICEGGTKLFSQVLSTFKNHEIF